MRLDLGLGKKLGGAEAKLDALGVGHFAAAVDDERQGAQRGLRAQPVNKAEAIAVGQGEVEDEQVGRGKLAAVDGFLAGGSVVDAGRIGETGDDDGGEVGVVFDEQDVGGPFASLEDAGKLG